ncbi:biopolymer transporter ExbD [bacterium SCSIO 12741]|nr:biopolymer transporter ExbD [bacterium SCSIO 12741]
MGKKKKGKQSTISTSSLPDIVFILLFFFMTVTVMQQKNLLLKIREPHASEAERIQNRSLVSYIYIGSPIDTARYGRVARVQLNDAFADPSEIGAFVEQEVNRHSEAERGKWTASLKVDQEARMENVTQVKQELRKSRAFKLLYSTYP